MNDEKFLGLSIWSPWWPRIIIGMQVASFALWIVAVAFTIK